MTTKPKPKPTDLNYRILAHVEYACAADRALLPSPARRECELDSPPVGVLTGGPKAS